MKKLTTLAISVLLFTAFSCFYGCGDPQDENEEDKILLLEGMWSSDPMGVSNPPYAWNGTISLNSECVMVKL